MKSWHLGRCLMYLKIPLLVIKYSGDQMVVGCLCICLVVLSGCTSSAKYSVKMPEKYTAPLECVVLLHGLGRTYNSMARMRASLQKYGYLTVNLGYPSRSKTIEQIAAEDLPGAVQHCLDHNAEAIHFVTHSMGGIIVRQAFKENRPVRLGKVVMLSPPNKGSTIVDELMDRWYFTLLNGPAGQQLSTSPDSLPNTLGPVNYPVRL